MSHGTAGEAVAVADGTPSEAVLGAAPPIEVPPAEAPPATSRLMVLGTYALVLVLLALRIPQTYAGLSRRVPPELSAEIHDPGLEGLALKTGVFLAFLVTALAIAIFFGLAKVLETRVCTGTLRLPAGRSVGLYCLVVAVSVVPLQAVGLLAGSGEALTGPFPYLYAAAVGLLAPLLYRSAWRAGGVGPATLVFGTSAGLAMLTVIG